jgi:uncharacterized membrane protein YpjA
MNIHSNLLFFLKKVVIEIRKIIQFGYQLLFLSSTLRLVLICNVVGTVYGYYWYKNQLVDVWLNHPNWMILFVPDSPTSTLFFVLAMMYVLWPQLNRFALRFKPYIEAIAIVSSIKYGLWAVAIILAGAYQGVELGAIDLMLMGSHLIMAVQVIVYTRMFDYTKIAVITSAFLTLLSDYLDYKYWIFPWLSAVLMDDLYQIKYFTIGLSFLSILVSFYLKRSK